MITTRSSEERQRLPLAPARRGRAAASGDAGDDPHRSGGCRRPRETGPHLRSGSFCPRGIRITGRQRLPVPRLRGGPRGPLCVSLAPGPRTVPAAPALLACGHSESRVPQGPPCCLCSSLPAARTRSLHDPAGRVSPVSHAKWRLKKVLFPSDPVDLSFDRPRPERLAGPASPPSPHGPVPGPGHSAASARHLRVRRLLTSGTGTAGRGLQPRVQPRGAQVLPRSSRPLSPSPVPAGRSGLGRGGEGPAPARLCSESCFSG